MDLGVVYLDYGWWSWRPKVFLAFLLIWSIVVCGIGFWLGLLISDKERLISQRNG